MATLNLNQINLVGRLGKDPDVLFFESGKALCKMNLAVRRDKDKTDWFELECWDKTAEIAANYTQVGSLIGIEGELKLSEWTDKETGLLRCKPIIIVNRIELLSSANKADNNNDL
jgi:single-strand DNA-binding protein